MSETDQPQAYTLQELNSAIRAVMGEAFPMRYWVIAEISEMHPNVHCYMELVERNERDSIVARMRAMIWASHYTAIKSHFEEETGMAFAAGIKVMVQVAVTFHEVYGLSLTLYDINPTYTIGDAARRRAEILRRLEEEGVAEMNRELPLPVVPQRIAVVSSGRAAGYGDFMDQLRNNPYRYRFYPVLFPAVMQGESAESSIIAALDRINEHIDKFDCVVIIRGGGSTTDLSCFDSYPLAANVAQFPLPVVAGIGHDRDETVLDYIAAVRVKTPTAAAEWIIARTHEADLHIDDLCRRAAQAVEARLLYENNRLQRLTVGLPLVVTRRLNNEQNRLTAAATWVERSCRERIATELSRLTLCEHLVPERVAARLAREHQRLDNMEHTIKLLSPDALLKRGYSLMLKEGRVVRSVTQLAPGDKASLLLADGHATATVDAISPAEG